MSLFGFPSGLAGGSKETEYSTDWQTNKSTTLTTSRSTAYPTYRSTSQETTHTSQSYNVLYGSGTTTINTGELDTRIAYAQMIGSNYFQVKFFNNFWDNSSYLFWPAHQVYGWNAGDPGKYPINPANSVYVDNGSWIVKCVTRYAQMQFTVMIQKKVSYAIIRDGANPVITNTTGNTSWSTQGGVYQQNTEYGTSGLTDFQTDQLTSHITYG